MTLGGERILLRVYLRSADRAPHVQTADRLVVAARQAGLAGATVLHGILGFGSRGILRPTAWSFTRHVPILVEIVDSAEKIAAFVAGPMDELMLHGLATVERAWVTLYRPGGARHPVRLDPAPELPPLSTVPVTELRGSMKSRENGILLRVFIGESDVFEDGPLHEAIVRKVRETGCAGATVLQGVEGFGAKSVIHKSALLEMSADLPLVIEIVDSETNIRALLPHLETMVTEGMITMEHVVVLQYRDG